MGTPPAKKESSRNFCLTDFKFKAEFLKEHMKFLAFSEEICPKTKKKHLQGWVVFWKKITIKKASKYLPTCHLSIMRGGFADNDAYCSKSAELTKFGVVPSEGQGKRRDVTAFRDRLIAGESLRDVAMDMPETYCQYRGGLRDIAQWTQEKKYAHDREMPEVYIRIGEAGVGKTRWLDEQYGPGNWRAVPPTDDGRTWWFDTCDSVDVIVFDDVKAKQIPPLSLVKQLFDRYPKPWKVKGGFIFKKWKSIVFTSNQAWTEWWPDMNELDKAAILRRIKKISYIFNDPKDNVDIEPNAEEV